MSKNKTQNRKNPKEAIVNYVADVDGVKWLFTFTSGIAVDGWTMTAESHLGKMDFTRAMLFMLHMDISLDEVVPRLIEIIEIQQPGIKKAYDEANAQAS